MAKRYWAKGLKRRQQFQVLFSGEEMAEFRRNAKALKVPMVEYARCKILDRPLPSAAPAPVAAPPASRSA